MYLWRVWLLNLKENRMAICYIMNRCLVMFLRGEKVNVVQYCWNIGVKLKVNKWSFSKWSLLKMLTMNSLNVKHQGRSSNQLAFRMSAYRHLRKLWRAIFQNHKKYKLTVWIFQSLIFMIKMTCKRKWMSWLSYKSQWRKNLKQYHIQNQSKFLPWYLINGLKCTVQNILISLNTLFELHMKSKSRWSIGNTCS